MADSLDPEQTQEGTALGTTPVQIVTPTQPVTQSASSLDEFLNGTPEEQQAQQAQQNDRQKLDEFLNGTTEEKDAIDKRLAVARQVIDMANDPKATDLLTSLSRKH